MLVESEQKKVETFQKWPVRDVVVCLDDIAEVDLAGYLYLQL